jgi:uncharacterized protein (TIGR04255 family)
MSDLSSLVPEGRHYEHAPIAEAIIDIQCELPPGVTLDELGHAVNNDEFTRFGSSIHLSGQVDVSEATIKGDTTGEIVGHIFRAQDGRRFIQSRLNGFSYSLISPYDRWEIFSGEALTNWTNYEAVAQPVKATRIGVRYVNRIDVPSASIEIKDYLRTAVDVSPYLPQAVAGYFLQVVVPVSRFDASATITSTLVPPSAENMTSLILDIDTWRITEISLGSTEGNDSLREQLESLRVVKNYVFESCITDATRGVISLCQYLCQPGEAHH